MRRLITLLFALTTLVLAAPATAALRIFTCEPEWAALVQDLGGDRLSVVSATTALQDPHHIEARPSLIARLRQADLVVCTGAELEIGWLPVLLRQAGNANVQPGQPGYFEAATFVERLDVARDLDRSMGDVHAGGNPHVHTDPRRIAVIAQKLSERLAQIDTANAAAYRSRYQEWAPRWQQAIAAWTARAAAIKGARMVSHHKDWTYLYDWLGLIDAGQLEPKPGLPPSAAHLAALKAQLQRAPARLIIRTPYEDARPAEWLARETGIKAVVLPYTVGGTPQAKDLYTLFDDTIARLLEGAQ